jgi:AhpD family alkylhydroperoxidase
VINQDHYHDCVRKGIAEIGRGNLHFVPDCRSLGDAGKKTDLLGARARRLIALAAAVMVQCDGCIGFHALRAAAFPNGAAEEEMLEALSVGIQVKAGPALIFSTRALGAVNAKRSPTSEDA